MSHLRVSIAVFALVVAACGDDDASPTTTQAESPTTTQAESPTTTEALATTVPETTTTTVASAALSDDVCDRIDIDALQEALGAVDIFAGSPFGVDGTGARAQCRFGITYSGNLGTGFTVTVYGPAFGDVGFGDAFDFALGRWDASDVTDVDGLGTRAVFLIAAAFNDSAVLVVEYEGGWVVEANADNDDAYGGAPPDEVLRTVIDELVAPNLLS